MKLLKKLLPLASAASVAAIVAPIASSCGPSSGWLKANYDLNPKLEGYAICPESELPPQDDWATATKRYAQLMTADTQFVYNEYTYWLSELDWVLTSIPAVINVMYPSSELNIVYLDVNSLRSKITNFKVDATNYTFTYDLKTKINLDLVIELPPLEEELLIDPQFKFNLTVNFDAHYEKCPFTVWVDYFNAILEEEFLEDWDNVYGSACIIDPQRLMNEGQWSQEFKFDVKVSAENEGADIGLGFDHDEAFKINRATIQYLTADQEILFIIGELFGGWSSYYYSNMKWSNPFHLQ